MDREAYGWGVRDIDEGWGGLWIQKDVDSGGHMDGGRRYDIF